jgi:hypothetical protein
MCYMILEEAIICIIFLVESKFCFKFWVGSIFLKQFPSYQRYICTSESLFFLVKLIKGDLDFEELVRR